LVVDDSSGVRRTLERILTRADYETELCADARTALGALSEHGFDAVISDIKMPGMDGIDLLRAVRRRDLDLPVLLVTGFPSLDTAMDAIEYGAFRYLTKPFDHRELLELLEKAVPLYRLAKVRREAMTLLGRPGQPSDRAGLEAGFARALSSLWMAYQPLVRVADHSVCGYEALLRTEEPSLPHPGAVIEAAEQLGRLSELSRAVRDHVANTMLAESGRGLVFLNLHPLDLADDGLLERDAPLAEIADRTVFEITERASLASLSNLSRRVAEIREIGYRIALDDLGAGYSSLTSFALLEPDFVKVDMSLVRDVETNTVKQRLIRSVTTLCADMGIEVVGEGVETPDERDALVELGCDVLQGFLFARPARPFPDFEWS
jgi:EAL domain-containing protein (putative c-di-GMP-specific phosphodiesterase class I)/CheY-like chemotaxis protein